MVRAGPISRTLIFFFIIWGFLPQVVFGAGTEANAYSKELLKPIPSCSDSGVGIDSISMSFKEANCGASDGAAYVDSVYGGVGPYDYSWSPDKGNSNSSNYNGIPSDTYTVEVTDTMGCSYVDSIFVQQDGIPGKLTTKADDPTCNGGSDGSATVKVQGGKSPYTYSWSTGDTTQMVTGLSAGTYYMDVTTSEGCTSSDTVTLQDPAAVQLSLDSLAEPLCYGDSTGYGEVSVQNGTAPYSFEWSTNPLQTGQSTNGLYAGSFTVSVTDDNGCTDSVDFSLGQPAPLTSSMSVQPPSCNGGNDGSVSVSVGNGTSPFQYDWAGYPSQNGSTLNNIGAGTYTVDVTDDNGCTIQDTAQVGEPPALSLKATQLVHPTCNGSDDGSITVKGNGGTPSYAYHWQGLSQSGPSVSSLDAGTYTVELVDANGCALVDSFQLQEPAPLQVQVDSIKDVSCNGDSDGWASASASGGNGGYTYTWDLGASQQSGTSASGLSAGSYTVQVTDSAGCTAKASFQVNEPAQLSLALDSSSDPLCYGDANGSATVSASGGTSPYAYSWSTNPVQNGQQAQNLTAGTYTVTVSDDNGCNNKIDVTLNEPNPLSSSISGQAPSCHGGTDGSVTVDLKGGTPSYQYDWKGYGSTSKTLTNVGGGTYVVECTDANGCTIKDTAQLGQPAPLSLDTLNMDHITCHGGEDGSISVNVKGGTTPYDLHWTNTSQSGTQIGGLQAGTYVLEVTDAHGCALLDSFKLQEPSPLQVQVSQVFDVSCHGGSDGMATASASGGTGPYSFHWNVDSPQTGKSAFGLSAGNHSVIVTDAEGCQANANFHVDEPAPIDVQLTPVADTICPGDSVDLNASATGGNGQYIYVWDQGLGTGASHTVAPSQSTNYNVIAYDSSGCTSAEHTVEIAVRALDRRAFGTEGGEPVCRGEVSSISAYYGKEGGTITFHWDQGIGNGPGPHHVLPNDTTTYTVTISDQCQNQLVDSVTVPVHPKPPIDVKVSDVEACGEGSTVCRNDTTRNVNTELKWSFSTGETSTDEEPTLSFSSSGQHSAKLKLTNQYGCTKSEKEEFSVEVHPVPSAKFEVSPDRKISIMDAEARFHYNDPHAIEWAFAFGDGDSSNKRDPVHQYDEVGTYPVTLTARTMHGCEATHIKEIVVEDRFTYYVPNAFSPDGDGVNEEFDGKGAGYTAREMMIFNRWGELIYESTDPDKDWDGTVNGEKVKPDVYVYKIRVKDHKGNWHNKTGHVTVVR